MTAVWWIPLVRCSNRFLQDIQLGRDGNVLLSRLSNALVASITIDGNKAISTDDLMKGSGNSRAWLKVRASSVPTLEGVRNELQRQYVAQGRYSATVDTEVVPTTRNAALRPGQHQRRHGAAIQHINVVGNTVFPEPTWLTCSNLKNTNWLSFFKAARPPATLR